MALSALFTNVGNTLGNTDLSKYFNTSISNVAADAVNNGFKWSDFLTNQNVMDNIIKPIAVSGGLWGAWNQQRMAKKQYNLQKDAYNYNKFLSEDERRRRNEAEANFNAGFGG